MASPARDARLRVSQQRPNAVVHSRGRGWLKMYDPTDGRYILDTSTAATGWHLADLQTEVNTAIQSSTGAWQYEMVLADYHIHMRDTFNAGNILEYRDPVSGQWVIFDPQSINWIDENLSRQQIAIKQAVSAQTTDDVMTFPQAYGTGKHFRYQCQTGRLQKLITIDNFSDLPAPTVQGNQIWFEAEFSLSTSSGVDIYLDGVKWAKTNGVRVRTSDRIEFRDLTGTQVFWWLDYPRAFDSAPGKNISETIGQMEVRRQGGPSNLFITVRIPYEWMQTAIYPVYVDPTVDYYIDNNDNDCMSGSDNYFGSGYNNYLIIDDGDSSVWHSVSWRFTSLNFSGTIDTGTLVLERALSSNSGANGTIRFRCEDTNSPAIFSTSARPYSRTYRTNYVEHTFPADGTTQNVNVASLLQELLDTAGYVYDGDAADAINITAKANDWGLTSVSWRTLTDDYNYGSSFAQLHIEYTTSGPVIPVFMAQYRQRK